MAKARKNLPTDADGKTHPERIKNPDAKCPRLTDDQMDALVEAAWKSGANCARGGKNHVKVYPADGSRMIPIPATPSGHKTYQNKRTALRRAKITVD